MKTVSYQEYAREMEMAKKRLEEKTCVQGISSRIWIVNIGTDDKIEMGINISGTGDVPSIYAKRFAYCIFGRHRLYEGFSGPVELVGVPVGVRDAVVSCGARLAD